MFVIGSTVTLPPGARATTGKVVAVGDCGYGRCKWGAECVSVQTERKGSGLATTNYPAEALTPG